jgi:hypothetical protein
MNKIVTTALGLFVICSSSSGDIYTRLLTQYDLDFQERDNEDGPELSSIIGSKLPWESYNKWQCFGLADTHYDCSVYGDDLLVPNIIVETPQHIFHFDTHLDDNFECEQTLSHWRDLIDGGEELCIYAAQMPNVDLGQDEGRSQSLWYIDQIKGAAGYWGL